MILAIDSIDIIIIIDNIMSNMITKNGRWCDNLNTIAANIDVARYMVMLIMLNAFMMCCNDGLSERRKLISIF